MFTIAQLIALQVVAPLVGAPLCALIGRNSRFAWLFTALITAASFVISLALFFHTQENELSRYFMGGWEPPMGIEYRLTPLNGLLLLLVSAIGFLTICYARASVEREIASYKHAQFYAAFLLCFAGLLGILLTNDAFNTYVFLEISSLATYALIAMGKDRRALVAAFEYLILGSIGATFILIAIGLLYIMTGTLNISDLALRIQANNLAETSAPIQAALAFFTIGILMKMGVFPLHLWLTNGYTYAPSFVSSFLAATATKVMAYVLIRIILQLFGIDFSFAEMPLEHILLVFALLGMVVGSLVAAFQQDSKRLLAYSSVAQIGYILLGIGLASSTGLIAAILQIFSHGLAKAALFMAIGCIYYRVGGISLTDIRGIAKHMPWTMAAFALSGLSLIGVPGTAGFISKWYLITGLFEKELWWILVVLLITSLLAIFYIWKVIESAYFQSSYHQHVKEAPIAMLIPLWVTVALSYVFGFYTEWPIGTASRVAESLMGGSF